MDVVHFHPDLPAPRGAAVLARTDPYVEAVSRFVLDAALDQEFPPELRPARRCGVIRSTAVTQRTTLLLLRCRYHLVLPARTGERTQVAEEARMLAYTGAPDDPHWLTEQQVEALMGATADRNVPTDQAAAFAQTAIDALGALAPALDAHATGRGRVLLEAHRRVRAASGEIRRGLSVSAQLPVDVLGVYVYLPVPAIGAVRTTPGAAA